AGKDSDRRGAVGGLIPPPRADGTAPRPDLRPQIVLGAWGAVCGDGVLRGAVAVWRDAGLFAPFAAGNDGTALAPAAFPGAFAVGAVDDSTGWAAAWSGGGPPC